MAAITNSVLSSADLIKTLAPDGSDEAEIIEVLNETNAYLDDIPWESGNLVQGERTNVRVALPASSVRIANSGIPGTASKSAQIDDACAIITSKSELDQISAEVGGKQMVPKHRANEARSHIESLGQNFAGMLGYGSDENPGEFVGFFNRLNSLTGNIGRQVVDAGGTGSDLASILIVTWGKGRVMGIYPKDTVAGIERFDENGGGLTSIVDTTGAGGKTFPGYREYFTWRCGLTVKDYRNTSRVANIDISDTVDDGTAAPGLVDLLISALETMSNPDGGRTVIYMGRTLRKMLRIQIKAGVQAGGGLTFENVSGRMVMHFDGYPVRIVDQFVETEDAVV